MLILAETNANPASVSVPLTDAQHIPAQWSFAGEPQLACGFTLANAVEFTLSDGRTVTGTAVRFLPEPAEGSDALLETLAVRVEETSLEPFAEEAPAKAG